MKESVGGKPGQEGRIRSVDEGLDSWFNRVPIPPGAASQIDQMLDEALTEVFGAPSEIGSKNPKPNDPKLPATDRIPTPDQRVKPPFV